VSRPTSRFFQSHSKSPSLTKTSEFAERTTKLQIEIFENDILYGDGGINGQPNPDGGHHLNWDDAGEAYVGFNYLTKSGVNKNTFR
jgi:hypothetical protein